MIEESNNELCDRYTIDLYIEIEKIAFKRLDPSNQEPRWIYPRNFYGILLRQFSGINLSLEEIEQACEELVKCDVLERRNYEEGYKYASNKQKLCLPPYYTWPRSSQEFETNYRIHMCGLTLREELEKMWLSIGFIKPSQIHPKLLKEIVVWRPVW